MSWQTLAMFAVTEAALCFMPGPAVLLVTSQALARGTLASIWSNLGILAGNIFYFALSATGLGALLLAPYDLFFAVKWLGAAYLVWLGIGAFFGKSSVFSVRPGEDATGSGMRMLLNGIALQIANPKALLFFTALLPQFIDPTGGVALQVAILGATSVAIEFCVLLGYGMMAGRVTRLAARPRFAKITNRLAGSMLIAAGLGMAAIRRS
jgi:homoserine/homoserine lactone efflux protein